MYYSTGILSSVMPGSAEWISIIIAIINAAMTFPTLLLIEVSHSINWRMTDSYASSDLVDFPF